MTNLYEITGNLLAAFVVGLLAYLAPWVKAWFLANTDAATQRRLQLLVQSFARAAEQLYHDQDPAGTRRKQFVQDQLRALGVDRTAMLSGDSAPVVEEIAREIGLDQAVGGLLPQDKLTELEKLRSRLTGKGKLLYAGDGINDTPVLAAADIGIAMGGLGADAAIEPADVIIMGDEPSKIASGIRIARRTNRIAAENIVFAIAVKVLVMILSVLGHIELWAGVFADVGVCMLCVLNTLRINQK